MELSQRNLLSKFNDVEVYEIIDQCIYLEKNDKMILRDLVKKNYQPLKNLLLKLKNNLPILQTELKNILNILKKKDQNQKNSSKSPQQPVQKENINVMNLNKKEQNINVLEKKDNILIVQKVEPSKKKILIPKYLIETNKYKEILKQNQNKSNITLSDVHQKSQQSYQINQFNLAPQTTKNTVSTQNNQQIKIKFETEKNINQHPQANQQKDQNIQNCKKSIIIQQRQKSINDIQITDLKSFRINYKQNLQKNKSETNFNDIQQDISFGYHQKTNKDYDDDQKDFNISPFYQKKLDFLNIEEYDSNKLNKKNDNCDLNKFSLKETLDQSIKLNKQDDQEQKKQIQLDLDEPDEVQTLQALPSPCFNQNFKFDFSKQSLIQSPQFPQKKENQTYHSPDYFFNPMSSKRDLNSSNNQELNVSVSSYKKNYFEQLESLYKNQEYESIQKNPNNQEQAQQISFFDQNFQKNDDIKKSNKNDVINFETIQQYLKFSEIEFDSQEFINEIFQENIYQSISKKIFILKAEGYFLKKKLMNCNLFNWQIPIQAIQDLFQIIVTVIINTIIHKKQLYFIINGKEGNCIKSSELGQFLKKHIKS